MTDSLDVVQVIPSISEEASGPTYSVTRLSDALIDQGARVQLHSLGDSQKQDIPHRYKCVQHPRRELLRRLGRSPEMYTALRRVAQQCDVVHNHSLWMMPNVYSAWATRDAKCRLVMSPRGTLLEQALRRSIWRKRLMWTVWQGQALRESDCLVATAESELRAIRHLGLQHPVALIPNGIDVPPRLVLRDSTKRPRRLLFFGRIHPIKNVACLLRSWRQLQNTFTDWELHVVGPDRETYAEQMKQLAIDLKLERICFPGPAYGDDKMLHYQNADLFVLPTQTENFGIAIAEALANGLPVVTTKGAPWQGLDTHNCGWWIDHGEPALVESLCHAMSLPPHELNLAGQRGRDWVQREFSWQRVGKMTYQLYEWLLGTGAAPSFVELN